MAINKVLLLHFFFTNLRQIHKWKEVYILLSQAKREKEEKCIALSLSLNSTNTANNYKTSVYNCLHVVEQNFF